MLQRNMGESSTCVTQPFCYSSGFSNESNKDNQVKALGESVSFGRFMTESLAWEKWSTFSNNRYVEEAERFSKPGSVAEKKAFFEAHYKKLAAQKAAALLEQAKNESLKEQRHDEAENASNSNVETSLPESENKVDEDQLEKKQKSFVGNSMQNQLDDFHNDDTHKDLSVKQGSNSGLEDLQSMDKSTDHIVSDIATPMNNKASLRKKRSKAKSIHMSVKFAVIREISRFTSSVMRKFETARVVGSGSSTTSKDRWTPLTTPTKASKNELQKHPSFSPLTEKKRCNMESPIISSPLRLRTEDRAASRKKKLWKKASAYEAQKVELNIKLKERAHTKTRKPRLCFCFKPRPLPESNNEGDDSKRGTKEESLKSETRVTSSVVQSKVSLSAEILTTYENTSPNIQHGIQHERNY